MTVIMWKDEDEINGVACGPTYLVDDRGVIEEDLGWQLKPDAIQMAKDNAVEFEEA